MLSPASPICCAQAPNGLAFLLLFGRQVPAAAPALFLFWNYQAQIWPMQIRKGCDERAGPEHGLLLVDVWLRAEHLLKRTCSDVELNRAPRASFRFLAEKRDGILTPGGRWFALGALVFAGEPGLESGV